MRNVRWYILVFFAACAAVLASCDEPVPYGTAELLVSGSTGSKSITPGPSAAVAKVLFGGTRSDGTGLAGQTVDLSTGKGEVSGITVGTWTFTATGLNAAGDVVTEKAERGGVVIASGKSTPVAFTLRYLTEGSGTYRLTVCWPEGLSFKGVRADLGGATVEGTVSGSSAVFSGSLEVGDYGVGVDLTNPSGTVIGFPNLEMVNVFKGLESEGTVTLDGADFMRAAAPVVTVSAVAGGQRVTVTSATGGATVYYTTDGSDPATSGTRAAYASPFTLGSTRTVRAIAAKEGLVDSPAVSQGVTVGRVAAPVIAVSAGAGGQQVTVSCATSGAVIHYTTDGSTPTSSSAEYVGAVTLTSTKMVKAIAVKSGMADSAVASQGVTIGTVSTPTFSLPSGDSQNVTVSCATSGAVIYRRYSVGGGTYTDYAAGTSVPVTQGKTISVQAYAVKDGLANSAVGSVGYGVATAPTFSKSGGTYTDTFTLTLGGDTVRYKTGSGSYQTYGSGISVTSTGTAVRAFNRTSGKVNSAVVTNTYTLKVATPSISSSDVIGGKEVTITSTTVEATIHYTTDGSVPTASSPIYSGVFMLTSSTTVKALAVKNGFLESSSGSNIITISKLEKPVFSPTNSTFISSQVFTLNCSNTGATIYYTVDDSTPTTSSSVYKNAITIYATKNVNAIATKSGVANSDVASATYTKKVFEVGDTGPAGGKVFYDSTGSRYEAAPADESGTYLWQEAKTACSEKTVLYDGSTYDNWMLPSLFILNDMYEQRGKLQMRTDVFYWSSTEYCSPYPCGVDFGTGKQSSIYGYESYYYVRAIRPF